MDKVLPLLKQADFVQPTLTEDARVRTSRGGILFIIAFLFSALLAVKSLASYFSKPDIEFTERIEVDTELSLRLPIHLDITFPRLSCADVEFVALDVAGEAQLDISSDLFKKRLDPQGIPVGEDIKGHLNRNKEELSKKTKMLAEPSCGSCYGAELHAGDCCRTCHDVKVRYTQKSWDVAKVTREAIQCLQEMDHPEIAVQPNEGCRANGVLTVNKVAGNVHVALGTTRKVGQQVLHTFVQDQMGTFDTSHIVHELRFGDEDLHKFDETVTMLDNFHQSVDHERGKTAAIQYFIHLVPTKSEEPEDSREIAMTTESKHSSHHNSKAAHRNFVLPGVYFMYDFSPFVVVRERNEISLIDVITDLLTVAGGVLAIARLLDSALHKINFSPKT